MRNRLKVRCSLEELDALAFVAKVPHLVESTNFHCTLPRGTGRTSCARTTAIGLVVIYNNYGYDKGYDSGLLIIKHTYGNQQSNQAQHYNHTLKEICPHYTSESTLGTQVQDNG